VVIKAIKPKRFNDKAMRERLRYWGNKVGNEMLKDFEATTRTWEREVKFETKTSGGKGLGGQVTEVWTVDEIYRFVNNGTGKWGPRHAEYPITPKNAKALAFPSIFSPKTRPRVIGSGAGSHGPVDTIRKSVMHPGIEPREFTKEIEKKWTPRFKKEMELAMKDAAKASGHHMGQK
jgi:hypothetical protein